MFHPTTPTILVVEDDPQEAAHLHLTLHEEAELNIHTISDCTAALAYLTGSDPYMDRIEFPFPSLVVLDMHLPGHSGPRILKWIREQHLMDPLLVVILGKSSFVKTPGQMMEHLGNLTISFAPFLNTPGNEMARMILDLFELWRGQPLQKVR
jgi:CheY-like chemotaxis protein